MEIKTEHDIFWNYNSNTHKNKNKKWVSVEDMIKELNKYHGGIHPTCNICKLINQLKGGKE